VSESGVHDALARGEMPPSRLEDIPGRHETLPVKHPRRAFGQNEVWYHNWQGAAGLGDPIHRGPESVAHDLREGVISARAASEIYGLVLDSTGEADLEATARRREEIRRERLAGEPRMPNEAAMPDGARKITDDLWLAEGRVVCGCGETIGEAGNPLARAKELIGPLTTAGPVRGEAYAALYGAERFFLCRQICPGCGTQLETRVIMEGAPRPQWRLDE